MNLSLDSSLRNKTKSELGSCTIEILGIDKGRQYCIEDLEFIVENTPITLFIIVRTQHLTKEFCEKYILNKEPFFDGDDITKYEIYYYQPHLKGPPDTIAQL